MGKRTNGVIVLATALLDLLVGISWYFVLFPLKPEEITLMESAMLGSFVTLLALIALFLNYMVYDEMIKDD